MTQNFDMSSQSNVFVDSKDETSAFCSNVIECWYLHYRQRLLIHTQIIVKDRAVAEELLHDCFIKISRMPAIDRIKLPYAFLSKILTNLALDYLRKQGRQPELENEEILASMESNDEIHLDVIHRSRDIANLYTIIDNLPQRSRDVLLLVRFREMKLKEVAIELGISQTMVEKHLQRALLKCREAFVSEHLKDHKKGVKDNSWN